MNEHDPKRPERPSVASQQEHQKPSNLWFVDDENHLHTMWNLNRIYDPRD